MDRILELRCVSNMKTIDTPRRHLWVQINFIILRVSVLIVT